MNLCCSSASLPAEVPVFYLNHPADRVLTLGCPGARPNMAVAWDRGSEPIYRSEHSGGGNLSATPPRLLIDTGHHLVLKPAKTQDSGINDWFTNSRQHYIFMPICVIHFDAVNLHLFGTKWHPLLPVSVLEFKVFLFLTFPHTNTIEFFCLSSSCDPITWLTLNSGPTLFLVYM